jgi:hypothetical protein
MGLVISFGVDGKFDGKLLRERKRETRSTVFLIGPKISPDRRHDFRLIAWGNSSALTLSRVSVGIENIGVLDQGTPASVFRSVIFAWTRPHIPRGITNPNILTSSPLRALWRKAYR